MITKGIVFFPLSLLFFPGQGLSPETAERELRKLGVKFNPVSLYALFLDFEKAEILGKGNIHLVINDCKKFKREDIKYLQCLPNLKEIVLGLDFPDEWYQDLETLTQLEGLFMSGNYNDGRRGPTDRVLPSVAKLTNLQALSLLSTSVTNNGLRHLKGLKKLRWLSLCAAPNISNEGLVHLKDLHNLEDLALDGTNTTSQGLVHLQGLTKLRRLRLNNEEEHRLPGGLKFFANMTELRRLDARGLGANDDDLKALRNMTKLEDLNLCYTHVTDKGLEHLAGLTALKDLDLFGTGVTGTGLKHLRHLKNLRSLILGFCPLDDQAADHLRHMSHLEYLEITTTNMTKRTIEDLKKKLPKTAIK